MWLMNTKRGYTADVITLASESSKEPTLAVRKVLNAKISDRKAAWTMPCCPYLLGPIELPKVKGITLPAKVPH